MTAFVESFSTNQLLPPWRSEGLRNWSFVIAVETSRIQRHLDRYFNAPAPDRAPFLYAALPGPNYGLLCVAKHKRFSSLYGRPEGDNTLTHTEIYWTFPVTRYQVTPDNLLVDAVTVWIQPFAFDNNSYVMFSAREIWGTEMEMAAINLIEGATPGELMIDLAIEGIARFSPKARSHQIGCLRIGMTQEATGIALAGMLDDHPGLQDFVTNLIGAGIFTAGMEDGELTAGEGIEVNTLRQFRDVFDLDAAAYRAIVSSRTTHSNVREMTFYAGSNAKLELFGPHAIAETWASMFGLPGIDRTTLLGPPPPVMDGEETDWSTPVTHVEVALVVSYSADARFDLAGTLHTYGQI